MAPTPLLTTFVVVTVTLVWSAVFFAALITREYTPLIYASGPMAAVVAFATGIRVLRTNGNGKGK
jgi:hypothetical protein